jgi:hypothetical protein
MLKEDTQPDIVRPKTTARIFDISGFAHDSILACTKVGIRRTITSYLKFRVSGNATESGRRMRTAEPGRIRA